MPDRIPLPENPENAGKIAFIHPGGPRKVP
jgi:hypothetical protein